MKILHLLSQTHLTGPEVYAAMLCREQMAAGHQCVIVSDTLTVSTSVEYIPMSIHDRSMMSRLRNIIKLWRLCRAREIDLIHAHSRAASWIANIVCRCTRIGYVSTVHGRQSRRAMRSQFNIYGQDIIVVCYSLVSHLRDDKSIRKSGATIQVIHNGID